MDLGAGETTLTDLQIRDNRLQFTSAIPATRGAWLNSFDVLSGGQSEQSFLLAGARSNRISAPVSVFQGYGLASRPTLAIAAANRDVYYVNRIATVEQVCRGRKEREDDDHHDEDSKKSGASKIKATSQAKSERKSGEDDHEGDDDGVDCGGSDDGHHGDDSDDHHGGDGGRPGDDHGGDHGDDGNSVPPVISIVAPISQGLESGDNQVGRNLWRELVR